MNDKNKMMIAGLVVVIVLALVFVGKMVMSSGSGTGVDSSVKREVDKAANTSAGEFVVAPTGTAPTGAKLPPGKHKYDPTKGQ